MTSRPDRHTAGVPLGAVSNRRRGIAMVLVLTALVLCTMVFVTLFHLALAQARATRIDAWRVQASWLAESAGERAAARLTADPDYAGETWQLAGESRGSEAAEVRIEIEPLPDAPALRQVRVRADYPLDPEHRARWEKAFTVRLETPIEGDLP